MIHYVLPKDKADREKPGFAAVDIPLPTRAFDMAEIRLTGRYPESGLVLNEQCDMVVRVLTGSVTFHREGEGILLSEGATVFVDKGRSYHWKPHVRVQLLVVSTPPWTPEQHKRIPAP